MNTRHSLSTPASHTETPGKMIPQEGPSCQGPASPTCDQLRGPLAVHLCLARLRWRSDPAPAPGDGRRGGKGGQDLVTQPEMKTPETFYLIKLEKEKKKKKRTEEMSHFQFKIFNINLYYNCC